MYCCARVHFIVFYLVALRDEFSKVRLVMIRFESNFSGPWFDLCHGSSMIVMLRRVGGCCSQRLALSQYNVSF